MEGNGFDYLSSQFKISKVIFVLHESLTIEKPARTVLISGLGMVPFEKREGEAVNRYVIYCVTLGVDGPVGRRSEVLCPIRHQDFWNTFVSCSVLQKQSLLVAMWSSLWLQLWPQRKEEPCSLFLGSSSSSDSPELPAGFSSTCHVPVIQNCLTCLL